MRSRRIPALCSAFQSPQAVLPYCGLDMETRLRSCTSSLAPHPTQHRLTKQTGRLAPPRVRAKSRGRRRPRHTNYVPSDHPAKYSSCSGVSRSILMPIDSSFSFATRLSSSSGTLYTVFSSFLLFFTMYSTESAWSAKLICITDAGCPSAADRLIRRPSPRRLILRPSFREYSSTKLRVVRFDDDILSSAGMSISTLKCPEFEMIAPSFIKSKCSLVSTLLLPVTVQNTTPSLAASAIDITRKPSITASSAFVGSTSVMITSAPLPRARLASPRPHQP